ncbi:glycosyltransferase family 4 protein [Tanticharoenia sakaeratensis]|uniref:Undecaprenyl-phosphate alpha N-acetylglucosaminyltransferase n=1 Tax=Tanticharoenia sakaeratensis NBRC 103193 TaxID=1231623 RepID=A0A0D6MJP8_9PROT|nr:hypothetical protein [Tanticharoenia sakaeratensis]GAN53879.1 undecaprenyl-phosphate alpha N-acetylglucosaminyltransferase [Tanticharoenia sakaeratensis NBRC 103193]
MAPPPIAVLAPKVVAAMTVVLLLAAMVTTAILVRMALQLRVMDVPVERSAHTRPIPKGGGIGILGGVVLFAIPVRLSLGAGWPDLSFAAVVVAGVFLGAISWADDIHSFAARYKLGAQGLAALIVIFGTLSPAPLPITGLLCVGGFMWLLLTTNALNFVDGLNGLCSGCMALSAAILAATTMAHAQTLTSAGMAALLILLACCLAAFLPFNFPRARIFMGDVGSQGAGLMLAGAAYELTISGAVPPWLAPSLLSAILFDVIFTLVRRAWAGHRLAQAHRGHLYQIAVRCGAKPVAITLLHWMFVGWGAYAALYIGQTHPSLGLVAVILPQLAWCAAVCVCARRRDIGIW